MTSALPVERVRSYIRMEDGKPVLVKAHERAGDEGGIQEELKSKEFELWKKWVSGGKKVEDMRELLRSFKPLIEKSASQYKHQGVRIHPAAINAEWYKQAYYAFETYDPSRGAALNTYLTDRLRKAKRFVYENQNVARIPEHRITKIREFQTAQEILDAQLGRTATDEELAKHLQWSVKEIGRMAAEIRRDLWSHSENWAEDPTRIQMSKEQDVLKMIKFELTEDERAVYHWYVEKGVQASGEIAKKTGFPLYKVSRTKDRIAEKMKRYLK